MAEDVLVDALRRPQHFDPAQIGHLDVRDQQIDRLALQRGDGRLAAFREQHLVALPAQHDRQQLAHRPLVVDHQNAGGAAIGGSLGGRCFDPGHVVTTARAGRRTDTVVPAPGRELT